MGALSFLSEIVAQRTYIRANETSMNDVIERYIAGLPSYVAKETASYLRARKIVPSMRMFNFFPYGRDEMYYNCSYLAIDSFQAIAEVLYLLACGCGVGFSVEHKCIRNLPVIQPGYEEEFCIEDCRESWADSILTLLRNPDATFLYHKIRPAGSPLSVGGTASGPEPLKAGHEKIRSILHKAVGRHLRSIEVFDICCHIADLVVVGGVRRSAMIALFDADDAEMIHAKAGSWWDSNPQRARANISAVLPLNISYKDFHERLLHAIRNNGEPGYFFRLSDGIDGLNPCGEIGLESCQFCNLSEIIASNCASEAELLGAARAATIIGTFQSTFTNFRYIRDKWRENCERDRLLGVSFTGVAMNPVLCRRDDSFRDALISTIKHTNAEFAAKLGINRGKRLMSVKPSGTTSAVYGCSSGIHLPYSEYYLRSVRVEQEYVKQALKSILDGSELLIQDPYNPSALVVSVPVNMHSHCGYATDADALNNQMAMLYYMAGAVYELSEGNIKNGVSCTLNVSEKDLPRVSESLYHNRRFVNRCTVFPVPDEIDKEFALKMRLPFVKISREEYESYMQKYGSLLDAKLFKEVVAEYKRGRNNGCIAQKEFACGGGACEVI